MQNNELKADHERELYFILTLYKHPVIADLDALHELNLIHSSDKIGNLFLRHDEDFPVVERYCRENSYSPITITRIFHNTEVPLSIKGEFPQLKRLVYISNKETESSLEEIMTELKNKHIYIETRIVSSS